MTALVTGAAGKVVDAVWGDGASPNRSTSEIARFDGIASHFADARALLDFFDQHDNDIVYLRVGFPKHSTGSGGNVVAETVPYKGGDKYEIKEISLMTKCSSDRTLEKENPTTKDGCTGASLDIRGPETDDSGTFFEHGVPVIKGYFKVDVTGGLHMGLSPILLKPLTFEQATQR